MQKRSVNDKPHNLLSQAKKCGKTLVSLKIRVIVG